MRTPTRLLEKSTSEYDGGMMIGRDPRKLTVEDFKQAGVDLRPVAEAVRAKCIDCCAGSIGEVRKCTAVQCPLWPLRMGVFPRALRKAVSAGKAFKPAEQTKEAAPSRSLADDLAKEIFG